MVKSHEIAEKSNRSVQVKNNPKEKNGALFNGFQNAFQIISNFLFASGSTSIQPIELHTLRSDSLGN